MKIGKLSITVSARPMLITFEDILDVHVTSHPSITNFRGHPQHTGPHSKLPSSQSSSASLTKISYSSAPEILQYFKTLADEYKLRQYVKLSHKVVGAWWKEETQEWHVKIQRGENLEDVIDDKCNILVNASGVLK